MKVSVAQGSVPLLISFPHSGTFLPGEIESRMTQWGRAMPDTAWFLPRLFTFASELGCSTITANFSRYLIDVDQRRQPQLLDIGPAQSPLCATRTTQDGSKIYLAGSEPDQFEVGERVEEYWRHFHDDLQEELLRIKHRFGIAILLNVSACPKGAVASAFDMHIRTDVANGCNVGLFSDLEGALGTSVEFFPVIESSRSPGYIVRHYGNPPGRVHALDVMIVKQRYMNEQSGRLDAARVADMQPGLRQLVQTCIDWARMNG